MEDTEAFPFYVVCCGARNLKGVDKNGLSDPYVTFQIKKFRVDIKGRQKKVQKTSVKKQTLDPTWDFECFPFPFLDITETIKIVVLNSGKDDFLGTHQLSGVKIKKILTEYNGEPRWFVLKEKHLNIGGTKEDLGEICLKFVLDWKVNLSLSPTQIFIPNFKPNKKPEITLTMSVEGNATHSTKSSANFLFEHHSQNICHFLSVSDYQVVNLEAFNHKKKLGQTQLTVQDLKQFSETDGPVNFELKDKEGAIMGTVSVQVVSQEVDNDIPLPKNATLVIQVRAGINIPPLDKKKLSSPAVRITARGSVWTSDVVKNCMHPVWPNKFELIDAVDSEEIFFEVIHSTKLKSEVLATQKLRVVDIRHLLETKLLWQGLNEEVIREKEKAISKDLMKEKLETVKVSSALECLDKKITKNFIRQRNFATKRSKLFYKAIWIDMQSKWDHQQSIDKFEDVAKFSVASILEQATKVLEDSNKKAEKEIIKKQIADSGKIDRGKVEYELQVNKADHTILLHNLQEFYGSSRCIIPRRSPMGELVLNNSAFNPPQLGCIFAFEDPIITLRNLKRESQRNKKGIVHNVKKARSTYKMMANTKVADVGVLDILKAFKGDIYKGGVTKEKFTQVVTDFGLEEFPVDLIFLLFDPQKTGEIEFKTVKKALNLIMHGTPDQKLRLTFDAFAPNGKGEMSRDELKAFLKMIIQNGSLILDRIMGTVKEGMKDIKEDVLPASPLQKVISSGQKAFDRGLESGKSSVKKLDLRGGIGSLDLRGGIGTVGSRVGGSLTSRMKPPKPGQQAVGPLSGSTGEFLSPTTSVETPRDHSSGSSDTLSDTPRIDFSLSPGSKRGSEDPNMYTRKRGSESMTDDTSVPKKRGSEPSAAKKRILPRRVRDSGQGKSPNGLGTSQDSDSPNMVLSDPHDIQDTLQSQQGMNALLMSDHTITTIVNLCFKMMKLGDKETITFEEFTAFAKNEPIVANFFGFGKEQKDRRTKTKAKKSKRKYPSVYKLYVTFRYMADQGGIDEKSFKKGLKILDIDHEDVPIESIFLLFDKNGSGFLDFSDLIQAFGTIFGGTVEDKIELVYTALDRKGSGKIDGDELFRFFQAISIHLSKILSLVGKAIPGKKAEQATQSITDSFLKPSTINNLVTLCFMQAGVDPKEGISLEMFKTWILNEPLFRKLAGLQKQKYKLQDFDFDELQSKIHLSDQESLKQFEYATNSEKDAQKLLSLADSQQEEAKVLRGELDDVAGQLKILLTKKHETESRDDLAPLELERKKNNINTQISFLRVEYGKIEDQRTSLLQLSDQNSRRGQDALMSAREAAIETLEMVKDFYLKHPDPLMKDKVNDLPKPPPLKNSFTFSDLIDLFRTTADEGGIVKENLALTLDKLGLKSQIPVDFIFLIFDSSGKGIMDFGDLISMFTTLIGKGEKSKYAIAFRSIDRKETGQVPKDVIFELFGNIVVQADPHALSEYLGRSFTEGSERDIKELFAISMKEFSYSDTLNSHQFQVWASRIPFVKAVFGDDEIISFKTLKKTVEKKLLQQGEIKDVLGQVKDVLEKGKSILTNKNIQGLPLPYNLDDGKWEKHVEESKTKLPLKPRIMLWVETVKPVLIAVLIGLALWIGIACAPFLFRTTSAILYWVVFLGYRLFNMVRL